MPRMFGTDGVRGLANRDLTAQLALDLGDAAVRVLGDDERSEFESRRRALVGRDTRVSGDFLAAALSAGMSAGGFDVIDAGIIPTPGVAYLTSVLNVEMGAVISASHNPMPDNGIKFFARGGFKLPDTKEDEIEAVLGQDWDRPTGAGVGRVSHDTATATNLYIDHLVSAIAPVGPDKSQPTPLKGLKIVADCANGATSVVAPEALRRAGADVTVINASPDGYNINKNAGSTHPEQLQAMVKASGAVMGVAFDGDADRCLAVDEDGNMVNGDQIMGILARAKKNAGKLNHDTLVVTVMSNLGLKLALRSMGIKTVQTNVGDRYVLEEMLRGDYSLGGEQSGHVINREFATTGDGTLTALTLCNEVVKSGKSLKELAADFPQLPQTLINVPNVDKMAAKTNAKVQAAVEREEKLLGDTGRVLLRARHGRSRNPAAGRRSVRSPRQGRRRRTHPVRARKEICPMFGHNSKVDLELNREVEKLIKTGGKEKIMPIVQAGEPVLRQQTIAYDGQLSRKTLDKLIDTMRTTMLEAPGVGLAATQIGLGLALAVVEDHVCEGDDGDPREAAEFPFHAIINPSYEPIGTETRSFYEGCLSFDGYQAVRKRWLDITARWQDEDGNKHEEHLHGWPARIFQHETDHLSGELYIDQAEIRSLTTNENLEDFWCEDPVPTEAAAELGFEL